MNLIDVRLTCFVVASFLCLSSFSRQPLAITKDEIITLTKLGLSPDEIIKAIDRDREMFELGIQDVIALKKAEVHADVIKHMLATPRMVGAPTPAESVGAPAARRDSPSSQAGGPSERTAEGTQSTSTEEETASVREALQRSFATGELQRGKELADDGDVVEAIDVFRKFLADGDHGPGTREHYVATFGIAVALEEAGLLQTAAKTMVEVVLQGPGMPLFIPAVEHVRTLRRKVSYSPPELEQLTLFSIAGSSQGFQDSYNYLLGKFFYDYGSYDRAMKYLDLVSPTAADAGRAHFITGVTQTRNQMYRSAMRSLQAAILATERNESDPEVAELSYLVMARILREASDHRAAVGYYFRTDSESPRLPIVLSEISRTLLEMGASCDVLRAARVFDSEDLAAAYVPNRHLVEALAFWDQGQWELVRAAVVKSRDEAGKVSEHVRAILEGARTPADLARVPEFSAGGRRAPLAPRGKVQAFLRADPVISQLSEELRDIPRERAGLQRLGAPNRSSNDELIRWIDERERQIQAALGIAVLQRLKNLDSELAEGLVLATELEIDLEVEAMGSADDSPAGRASTTGKALPCAKILAREEDDEFIFVWPPTLRYDTSGKKPSRGGDD